MQNVYCKVQIKNRSYMFIDLKKFHALMFEVIKSIYSNQQINLFMKTFTVIFDFKQVLRIFTSCCIIFSSLRTTLIFILPRPAANDR